MHISMSDAEEPQNNAASALAEAIDDFLGDLERKFKFVSDEILTKRKPFSMSRTRGRSADGGNYSG